MEKLPQNSEKSGPGLVIDILIRPKSGNSKKKAVGYIQERTLKGKRYYYYRRGTDKEIYLGTAEAILKSVKGG